MFKLMFLLKRKPGLTMQQFIDHYEGTHAPLAVKLHPSMVRYMRHFLHAVPYPLDGTLQEAEYDVLTEMWFENKAAYDEAMALAAESAVMARIREDEAHLFDMSKFSMSFVEEHESRLPGQTGVRDNRKDVRSMVLLQRKPGLTLDEFIEHYEIVHAPLGVKYSETQSRYRRFYLRPSLMSRSGTMSQPAYDVATEVSFASREDMKHAVGQMKKPEINAIIEADEATFIHKPTRRLVALESHESVLPWVDQARFTTW
jgi:EthD domain